MNLTALLIPPALDERQALRLRRLGLAALIYALTSALVVVAWTFGMLSAPAVLRIATAYLLINVALYLVFRSGFNLRFADPSLTRWQVVAGITVIMFIAYQMDDGREIALFGCFVVFLFGIFRLTSREFRVVTLYTLAAYALVINLLMHFRPEAIRDVHSEWMSWLQLAGFLPCFTIIGGHFNALRTRLRESEARFRSLTEMSSDFYWESDAEHRLTDRNTAASKLGAASMFRRGVQIGERRWEVPYLSPDESDWRAHQAELDAHRPFREFEHSRLGADGTERHISISGAPVFDASGVFKGYRGVGSDITARKRLEQELREGAEELKLVAHHDSLTGLPNRLLFNDRLDQAISFAQRNSRQFALLYLDLDKFKPVNDTLGHTAGDELLQGVAARIRAQVRASDTVARVGGDEFIVILLDNIKRCDAQAVARKIIAALAVPFPLASAEQTVGIGASIGIAVYPMDGETADELVKAADAAMYSEKQGGNTVLPYAA